MTARSARTASVLALLAVAASCDLNTTPPGELPHFAPAWKLVAIDGQSLPDTLALTLENSPPNTLHKIEAGAVEFTFPQGSRVLRWTFILTRMTDSLRFEFSFAANYLQFGADSIVFPTSRSVPPEFFGRKIGDSLSVVTIWLQDNSTPAALVGGSHTWSFARDTLFK
jgi:hypothetical protein